MPNERRASERVHDMVCKFPRVDGRLAGQIHQTVCLNPRKEPRMARSKKSTPEVEKVRPYLEGVAKSLVDRLYGAQGLPWGTKLTELEDVVLAVREVISENMLAQALERQAATEVEQRPAEYQTCPKCGRPVTKKPDKDQTPQPRNVLTRAGEAEWVEPEQYCRKCRRSFFPSEQEFGH